MSVELKKQIKPVRSRSFLNKDFSGFRADILSYIKTFYPDRIKDFSESSVGGIFLDMASYVGDVTSFYMDHQFNELNHETAVETKNIERHIRTAGVKITGASPAVVEVQIFVEIPAEVTGEKYQPQANTVPVFLKGSIFKSNSGVSFELAEDLDFSELDEDDNFRATVSVSDVDASGNPSSYVMMRAGVCLSGTTTQQSFVMPRTFSPYRKITLSNENVTDILRVFDSDGNVYYQVDALTQDVVFKGILNLNEDRELVKENLEIIPAPYRYLSEMDIQTGLTVLKFGSGNAETLDDDIVPDPSDLSLPLYGKTNFSRFSIDPASLLQTRTLGISPTGTTVTVEYRYGGGLSHNVGTNSIRTVDKLLMRFKGVPSNSVASRVRSSVEVKNPLEARGGESAPTLAELQEKIPAARNSQSRIVTKEDLLARIYTMPSNFGRVFRAGIRSNSNNPLATQVFIISRDAKKRLIVSPDTLKKNLRLYLNQFRLISDAIDILDAQVVNLTVEFRVVTDPSANRSAIVQNIISSLKKYFDVRHFQIDQPILISDVTNIIINEEGVISLSELKFRNVHGNILDREYSEVSFNVEANTFKGLIVGHPGTIFEVRYPEVDIIGSAV